MWGIILLFAAAIMIALFNILVILVGWIATLLIVLVAIALVLLIL